MIQAFSLYIKNIAVFLIFTTFANIVIPDTKYKSYINLTLGFVMIFLILSPVKAIFNNPNGEDIGSMIDNFTNRLNGNIMQDNKDFQDDTQDELILSTFAASINGQIKSIVDKDNNFTYVNSRVDADDSQEHFGEIKAIYIVVNEKNNEEILPEAKASAKPIIRIETVEINTNSVFSSKYMSDGNKDSETSEIKSLKILLSDFYNLSYDNIYITVQKKN